MLVFLKFLKFPANQEISTPSLEKISNPMSRCSLYFREGTGLRVILCTSSTQVENVDFKCLKK